MAYQYTWWTPGSVVPPMKGTGIRIAHRVEDDNYRGRIVTQDLPEFIDEVQRCLSYIYMTATGRVVLDYLDSCTKIISIDPTGNAMGYDKRGNGNELKEVVLIIETGTGKDICDYFDHCNYDILKCINCFKEIPIYRQEFTPVFNWDGFRTKIQKTGIVKPGAPNSGSGLEWVAQRINAIHGYVPKLSNVRYPLIIMLYNASIAGSGCNAAVLYNLAEDDPFITMRPSSIGLAHELVHVYYSVQGLQPSGPDDLLDDLICIGIGPWINEPVSDNKIRGQWNAMAYGNVPVWDIANKVKVGLRTSHADLGVSKSNCSVM